MRRFRAALEQGGLSSTTFRAFPKGACGDAAELLGQYLRDSGLGEWTYCSGVQANHSHAWLERDGVVVDATADQFYDAPGPVVVTADGSFHARYSRMTPHAAGLYYYKGTVPEVAAAAAADYRLLKARADALRV